MEQMLGLHHIGNVSGRGIDKTSVRVGPPLNVAIGAVFAAIAVGKVQHLFLIAKGGQRLQGGRYIIRVYKIQKALAF